MNNFSFLHFTPSVWCPSKCIYNIFFVLSLSLFSSLLIFSLFTSVSHEYRMQENRNDVIHFQYNKNWTMPHLSSKCFFPPKFDHNKLLFERNGVHFFLCFFVNTFANNHFFFQLAHFNFGLFESRQTWDEFYFFFPFAQFQ